MAKLKLTQTELDTVLKILSSAQTCFDCASFDEDLQAYPDGGNFLCSFETRKEIKAISSAYNKILLNNS